MLLRDAIKKNLYIVTYGLNPAERLGTYVYYTYFEAIRNARELAKRHGYVEAYKGRELVGTWLETYKGRELVGTWPPNGFREDNWVGEKLVKEGVWDDDPNR